MLITVAKRQNGLIRANDKVYSIEEIHQLFRQWKKEYWDILQTQLRKLQRVQVVFDGVPIKVYSQRYELFLQNTKCAVCGLEANCYLLERAEKSKRYHFNLYYQDEKGNFTLFTKDHILPKSKGGKNWLSNYQTMCYPCNFEKGNTVN